MLLVVSEHELSERREALRQALSDVTGEYVLVGSGRGATDQRFLRITQPSNGLDEYLRVATDRGIEEWSVALARSADFDLYFAFDEQWQSVPKGNRDWRSILLASAQLGSGHKDHFTFLGLRLRFYLRQRKGPGRVKQWLRCEWEPYRYSGIASQDDGALTPELIETHLTFDAGSAAHPHFHVDSVPLTTRAQDRLVGISKIESVRAFGEPKTDFGGAFPDGFVTAKDCDLYRVHLPSSPSWPTAPFRPDAVSNLKTPLPHQHYPASVTELDNWFGWNIAYFKQQFEEALQN